MKRYKTELGNEYTAEAFASQRKDYYETAIKLMRSLTAVSDLMFIVTLILIIEHIANWF